jgi:hypothetical protein
MDEGTVVAMTEEMEVDMSTFLLSTRVCILERRREQRRMNNGRLARNNERRNRRSGTSQEFGFANKVSRGSGGSRGNRGGGTGGRKTIASNRAGQLNGKQKSGNNKIDRRHIRADTKQSGGTSEPRNRIREWTNQ